MKMTNDLIRIASAGGGLDLSKSSLMTADLMRIAAAAGNSGSRAPVIISGSRMTDDLIRICSAGRGCVLVKFE